MLIRLVIAVFALGLVVSLSGTAFSDVPRGELNPVEKVNPNNQRFNSIDDARPDQPAFKKPASALRNVQGAPGVPATPQDYFCDFSYYHSGSPYYVWSLPDAYGDDLFNMRFTSDANYDCTLKVGYVLLYALYQTGDPDIKVYLWDDDGFGFPGNKLDSVTILDPGAGLVGTNVLYWVGADFSAANWVFSDGEEYHIGWTPILNTGGDTLWGVSDQAEGPYAGEERSSEYWNGLWGTMLNDWGLDVGFFIEAQRCCSEIPFTDCYSQSDIQNLAYFWRAPHPVYGDSEYAQRFTVGGPETLVSVDLAIYNPGDGSFGNDDVIIRIYDDAAGLPGNLITSQTLTAGTYSAFPALTPVPFNTVMEGPFHVSFGSSATAGLDWESCLSSDGTDGVGGSSSYWDTSGVGDYGWVDMLNGWGLDVNFYFVANLCRDEFSECSINWCYNGLAFFWRLPDRYGDLAMAQKFQAIGEECKIKDVDIYLYWPNSESGGSLYSVPGEVNVYADAGGLPGAAIGTIPVAPADYAAAGMVDPGGAGSVLGVLSLDFEPLNATVSGPYWVGIDPLTTDTLLGIRLLSDNINTGGGGCTDGWAENWLGTWELTADGWGFPVRDPALVMEVEHCCIPYSGYDCDAPPIAMSGADYATPAGNYARTGHSNIALEDPWCDLTHNWDFEHPTSGTNFAGPTIYDNRVVCAFTTEYRVFTLAGAPLYTLVPQTGPFPPGNVRSIPTVDVIPGYNGDNPVLFTVGGTNQETHAWDFNTGAPLWARDLGTVGPGGLFGNTRWGRFAVVNGGLFYTTDDGYVVGLNATSGALLPGYPISLGLAAWVAMGTDGTQIFTATQATGIEGDIYAIDAATGVINWQLTTSGGLQGVNVWTHTNGYANDEGFSAGISYDAQRGAIYANSRTSGGDHPTDGLFYNIDANTGALKAPVTPTARALYATPMIDANRVYIPAFSRWATPPNGGDSYAVNKGTGVADWAVYSPGAYPFDGSGTMTCEPEPANDLIFVGNYNGFLLCYNASNGDEIFRRLVDDGNSTAAFSNRIQQVAMGRDEFGEPHVVFSDMWGNLVDLTKGVDRPRLEIQRWAPQTAVEFGPALSYSVVIDDIFVNTGCADLTFTSVQADENSFGPEIQDFSAAYVRPDVAEYAASIANRLADDAMLKNIQDNQTVEYFGRDVGIERGVNRAAAGFPTYLNAVTFPYVGGVIAAGDTADLELDVIQANILRGPQCFYIELGSNDPDFYLNDITKKPQIYVCLVGGCLSDTTDMAFGVGGGNMQHVFNTGTIADGNIDPVHGIDIDGDDVSYYQGAYVWGVSTYRVSVYTEDWTSGGDKVDVFVSMQPDPNWCDNECKPALQTGVTLGYMTSDGGLTYDPILGNQVCASYLDSVQDFWTGGWSDFGAPFDNDSSFGLYANTRTVGALDVPELHNVTLEILEITERNGGTVDNWIMSEIWDPDVGSDSANYNADISTAWCYNRPARDNTWGQIKIPFGCGETPMLAQFGFAGQSGDPGLGFWGWDIFWDSCYTWMDRGLTSGGLHYPYGQMSSSDAEAMAVIAAHDFGPNETIELGVAHFGALAVADGADANSPEIEALAKFVNKWSGHGRGDVNNDGTVNLADIIYTAAIVNGGPGAVPFQHLSDVDADNDTDIDDVQYLINYYFYCGPCPMGGFIF